MKIRRATTDDAQSIKRLRDSLVLDAASMSDAGYATEMQRMGFLLFSKSLDELKQQLSDRNYIYLVADDEGDLAGFIGGFQTHEVLDPHLRHWLDLDVRDQYVAMTTCALLDVIAVSRACSHQGVARKLLQHFETEIRAAGLDLLSAHVSLSPYTNIPSLLFHTRNGFRRVEIGLPRPLPPYDGYTYVHFTKRL